MGCLPVIESVGEGVDNVCGDILYVRVSGDSSY